MMKQCGTSAARRCAWRLLGGLMGIVICAGLPASGASVQLSRHGDQVEILIAKQAFATYHFGRDVAKPYMFPIRTASGIIITRSFPMLTTVPGDDRDEPHQRALYFAHGDINGLDFWGEAAFAKWSGPHHPFGRTVFRELQAMESGEDSGLLRALFDLTGPGDKPIGEETQSYRFSGGPTRRVIDCEFTLLGNHGPLQLGDTKEGTFAIRLAKFLDSPPSRMVNSNGAVGEKQIWGKRANWVDYDGESEGRTVGVAIFDNPQNLRHPTTWHARGYGLFAANPFGLREFTHNPKADGSITIAPGGALTLRYRVLIHEGNFRQAHVANAWQRYAAQAR